MCEFCSKHGDGKIWFKNAENYGKDLLSDLNRRKYINEFFTHTIEAGVESIGRLESIYKKKGRIPTRVSTPMIEQARIDHFGQVVTIEDIETIVRGSATIVRLPCACRWASMKKENRCCYSVSYTPDYWYEDLNMEYFGLARDEGLERISQEEAISQMRNMEIDGAIHTIWTMKTPFIGAICNCRPHDCLGLRTLSINIETMFRGETFAMTDELLCTGCGACEQICHFGAIGSKEVSGSPRRQSMPIDVLAAVSAAMPVQWMRFQWSEDKKLQKSTLNKAHYIFKFRLDRTISC